MDNNVLNALRQFANESDCPKEKKHPDAPCQGCQFDINGECLPLLIEQYLNRLKKQSVAE